MTHEEQLMESKETVPNDSEDEFKEKLEKIMNTSTLGSNRWYAKEMLDYLNRMAKRKESKVHE